MYQYDGVRDINVAKVDASGVAQATQATPDVSGVVNATINTGKSRKLDDTAGLMVAAVGEATKMKIEGDIFNAGREGESLSGEFLRSNMHANEANATLAKIDAAKKTVIDSLAGQEVYGNESRVDAASQEMARLSAEAEKLKAAAEGGMSNEQYVARIDALTKKYVGRYPGLADKIRETVGHATGMPGADLWAQQQYVRDRFAKPEKDPNATLTTEKLVAKDIDDAAQLGLYSREELFSMYQKDRGAYNSAIDRSKKITGVKSAEAALKAELAMATAEADNDADTRKASFSNIVSLGVTSSVLSSYNQAQEQAFTNYLAQMQKGVDIFGLPEGTALLETHRAQMQTHLSNTRILARGEIQKYLNANPKISKEKAKELFDSVDTQLAEFDKKYAGKEGLFALATAMNTFRDKKIDEQMKIAELNIKLQGAMQNQPLVSMYMQGGDSRTRVEREQPHFAAFMAQLVGNRNGVLGGISDMVAAGGGIAVVQIGVKTAEAGGVITTPPGSDPAPTKAARDIVYDRAARALDTAAKTGTIGTKEDANCIKSAIATNIETGSCAPKFKSDSARLTKNFEALPPDVKDAVRAQASKSSVINMQKLQEIRANIEAEHGVILKFGVNDAGEIAGFYDTSARPVIKGTPTREQSDAMKKALAAEAPYVRAMEAFFQKAKPLTSNLVYGRSVVMGQPTKEIAKQYAEYLNTRDLPFTGFYSTNATSAAGAEGDGGSEPSKKPVISDWSQQR